MEAINTFLETSSDLASPALWMVAAVLAIGSWKIGKGTFLAERGGPDFIPRPASYLPLRLLVVTVLIAVLVWLDLLGGGRILLPFIVYLAFLTLVLLYRGRRECFNLNANAALRRGAACVFILIFAGYVSAELKRRWFAHIIEEGLAKLPKAH